MDKERSLIGAVHTVAGLLSSVIDADEVVRRTLAVAVEAVDAEGGSVFLREESTRALRFRHVVGGKGEELVGFTISETDGIAGRVFRTGQPQISNHVAADPDHLYQVDGMFGFETRSLCTVPLCYPGGRVVGVLQLVNKRSGAFTDEDLLVLDIVASVAAMSMLNADLAVQAQRVAALTCLGDLAHDIKNKLAPVRMGAYTLEALLGEVFKGSAQETDSGLADGISESLAAVTEGAVELERYTKFIADAAKGRSIESVIETRDLAAVVERQVASLLPLARQRDVDLVCEAVGRPVMPFDRFLTERAVYNLVNNALPETPAGGRVTVSVREEGDFALIEVSDTGRGMPPHVLESILAGQAISTKPGGTGLGTSIVKKMIEAQGGRFNGRSTEGQGTTFSLILPMQPGSM